MSGMPFVSGIGFTVSLLADEVSFGAAGEPDDHVTAGVLAESLVAARGTGPRTSATAIGSSCPERNNHLLSARRLSSRATHRGSAYRGIGCSDAPLAPPAKVHNPRHAPV